MKILLKIWEIPAKTRTPININDDIFNLALDVICKSVLDYDIGCLEKASPVAEAFKVMMEEIQWRGRSLPFPFLWKFFVTRERNYHEKKKLLTDTVEKMIQYHKENDLGHSIVKYLLQARDENGNPISDKIIRDETLNVFAAGHETTANVLGCLINHVSANPNVQKKLQAEIDTVLEGRLPEYSDIPKLKYLDMIIKETLRLDTPGLAFGRTVLNDDEIDGYFIPKHARIILSSYKIHRSPDTYPNPDAFIPERWETQEGRVPYIPFGGGVRICPGQRMAKVEIW